MDSQTAQILPYLIPLLLIAFVVRRNLRPQKLRVERLWLMPVILFVVVGLSFEKGLPTSPIVLTVLPIALVLGALAGWYRGRLTHISVDPVSHDLTSKASPWGVVLIAVLFIGRMAMRVYFEQGDGATHGHLSDTAAAAADGLLVFSLGLICAQRLELWIRAQRLLSEAIAAKATGEVSS